MNTQITLWDEPQEEGPIYTEIFRGEEVPRGYAEMVRAAEKQERDAKFYEVMYQLANKFDQPLIQITNSDQYTSIRKPLE